MSLRNAHKKSLAHPITKHAESGNGTGGMRISGHLRKPSYLQGISFYRETFLVTIDKIVVSLKERATSYQSVYTIFKVIVDSCNMTTDELRYNAQVLARNYSDDLSMDTFPGEIVQFVAFAKRRDCTTPADQAKMLCEGDLIDTFPNVHVALRMYLCIMVTCCSGERSFSKLALIKNDLRSTMGMTG